MAWPVTSCDILWPGGDQVATPSSSDTTAGMITKRVQKCMAPCDPWFVDPTNTVYIYICMTYVLSILKIWKNYSLRFQQLKFESQLRPSKKQHPVPLRPIFGMNQQPAMDFCRHSTGCLPRNGELRDHWLVAVALCRAVLKRSCTRLICAVEQTSDGYLRDGYLMTYGYLSHQLCFWIS